MKTLICILASFMSLSCASAEFGLLHYNIKELNSEKISKQEDQIKAVSKVLKEKPFDILSLNEVQYDLPNVPTSDFQTNGKNLDILKKYFDLSAWSSIFAPANTGLNAQRNSEGRYVLDPNSPGGRDLADQVNFGTVPAQYSTGAITHHQVLDKKVFAHIKWKDFNPSIDLTQFLAADGSPLPKDMQLFDKNFTDAILKIKDKKLHLVLLHTVPSFHFGNPQSPNYERNRDQLRFLEWYLTGKTDIDVNLDGIVPIVGESFAAVGDFNVDPTSEDPGAEVLKRLFQKTTPWMEPDDMSFTNEGPGFAPRPFRLMLDYIIVSKNIEPIEGEILHPSFQRIELGCGDNIRSDSRGGMVLKSYKENGELCHALVSEEYETYKNASDHYPIYGRFIIN